MDENKTEKEIRKSVGKISKESLSSLKRANELVPAQNAQEEGFTFQQPKAKTFIGTKNEGLEDHELYHKANDNFAELIDESGLINA